MNDLSIRTKRPFLDDLSRFKMNPKSPYSRTKNAPRGLPASAFSGGNGSSDRGNRVGGGVGCINYLGPSASSVIQMLRLLHAITDAFAEGFTSLRQVAEHLEKLSFQGNVPDDLPYSKSALSRCCDEAEVYFGAHFEKEGRAVLFVREGAGRSISGLTDLGVDAFALTQDFLVCYGIVRNAE